VSGAVGGQVGAVGVSQLGQSRRALDAECSSGGGAEFGADKRATVIGEADQACVEEAERLSRTGAGRDREALCRAVAFAIACVWCR
jgi:hypothetical protein